MPHDIPRGVYPILVTPFDETGAVDESSLRRLVDFNIEAGVHGLGIALGSEVFKLSESERDAVTRTVVSQVAGRVPVVVNTGAPGTDLTVLYSRAAENSGADALMVMPPSNVPIGPPEVLAFYRALSGAVTIPVFIQDTAGAPVLPALALEIAEACERVRFIKVEDAPVVDKVARMVDTVGDALTVFGGAGGSYFIEEMRRGSQGTMPFCSQPEAFVQVWDLFQAGDEEAARSAFNHIILPVNRLVDQGRGIYYAVHKRLLVQRGVIRSAKVRDPAPAVDAMTMHELERLVETLYS